MSFLNKNKKKCVVFMKSSSVMILSKLKAFVRQKAGLMNAFSTNLFVGPML